MGKTLAAVLKTRYGRIALLIFILFPALVGYQVFSSWQSATDAARNSAQNLALLLERDLSSDFSAIGRVGSTLAAEIDPESMRQASVGRYNIQMTLWLRSLVPAMERVETSRVFDTSGDLLYASEASAPRINIAHTPYFQKLKSDPASGEIYSEKIISQVTGHALTLRANAIRDARGSFLGIIVIGVNLSAIQQHFFGINVGHTGMLGLRRFDNGALVARFPNPVEFNNESAEAHPGRQAILKGELNGTQMRRSTTDGIQRIYAHRVIGKQTPFFVEVGLGESDYLAEWRHDAVLWSCVCLLFLLILAVAWYRLMLAQREQLKSEQEALDIGERLRGLYALSPLGIGLSDMQGRFVELNQALNNILGYSADELKALDYLKLTPPEYAPDEARHLDSLLRTGRYAPYEKEFIRKDGSRVPVRLNGIAISASNGKKYIWSLVEDITERKQSEEKQARLSAIVESSIVAIISRTLGGVVQTWNVGAQKMFGYSAAEMIGKSVNITVPSDRHSLMPKINDALARGEVVHKESRRITKDGRVFDVYGSHSPIKDASGKVVAVSVVFRDISENKAAEARMVVVKEAAEAANVAKSRFLATMSHELRTPMNAILGMAQVLRMPDISEAERLDYASTILSSGQTLLTLLNDILDLSKIEACKVDLESIALDPAQIVAETQVLFAQSARTKGLRMESDCSGVSRGYVGDAYRLHQMLSNLVGNAIKFTERGSVRIEARELARDAAGAVLEFSVIDTGIGVTKEEQSRLFQPFSQADSSITRSYGGSGLGLSLVAGMARLMGGEAGMESEAGGGSRFWFRIRAGLSAQAESLPPQPFAEAGALAEGMPAQFSGRVLVVEDNPANRKVIGILLHKFGLSTASAEDGQQALEAITQGEAADLILMDVHMPGMDGYAATQAIRTWEKNTGQARRPIIALTADAFRETRQRCLAAGMDEVLTKPLAYDILQVMLARWLPSVTEAAAAPVRGTGACPWRQPGLADCPPLR